MDEIKIDENTFKALDKDPMDVVSSVTSKARNEAKSRRFICYPTATT